MKTKRHQSYLFTKEGIAIELDIDFKALTYSISEPREDNNVKFNGKFETDLIKASLVKKALKQAHKKLKAFSERQAEKLEELELEDKQKE